MNHKLKVFIIFVVVLVLSFVLAQQAGLLYEKVTGYQAPGGWIGTCSECFDGFMVSFTFFSATLFFGILNRKRLNVVLVFLLLMPVISVFLEDIEAALYTLGFGIIGLILGQLVYLARKKLKSKSSSNTIPNTEK